MKYLHILFLAIPFLLQSYKSNNNNHQQQHGKHWVSLFNGKDISGWKPKIAGYPLGENFGNTFRVADKILSTRYNEYDSFNSRFGALYYDKKFTNYRLKVEYRFVGNLTPGAPSWGFRDGGIQYHCQSPATVGLNQPFPVCLEYNLLGGKDGYISLQSNSHPMDFRKIEIMEY